MKGKTKMFSIDLGTLVFLAEGLAVCKLLQKFDKPSSVVVQ